MGGGADFALMNDLFMDVLMAAPSRTGALSHFLARMRRALEGGAIRN